LLSGQSCRSWALADFEFRGGRTRAAIERDISALGRQWLGDLHRRHGVPFSRGELARLALNFFHSLQIADGKTGLALLVPTSATLTDFVEWFYGVEGMGSFKIASLMQLLPLYFRFLQGLGLLREAEGNRALKSLQRVVDRTVALLREDEGTDLAEEVERVWPKGRAGAA
jgi:hypothetical protein